MNIYTLVTILVVPAYASSLRNFKTLGCHCEKEHFKKLVTLSQTTQRIFDLDPKFGDTPSNERSQIRLRRHAHVSLRQNAATFMEQIHQKIAKTRNDLGNIRSPNADKIDRVLDFMAQIIAEEYDVIQTAKTAKKQQQSQTAKTARKQQKNRDLVVERATISLKRITATFISISLQCKYA